MSWLSAGKAIAENMAMGGRTKVKIDSLLSRQSGSLLSNDNLKSYQGQVGDSRVFNAGDSVCFNTESRSSVD
jgi:hypothetical protein